MHKQTIQNNHNYYYYCSVPTLLTLAKLTTFPAATPG